jgi:hypothetical protein
MPIINVKKKRNTSGSYLRIIGNEEVSNLITAIHSTAIRSGNEVVERLKLSYNGDLPIYDSENVNTPAKTLKVLEKNKNGVIIFNGYINIENNNGKNKKQEVDLIIFINNTLYCFEIKEGENLDTKKSKVELDLVESFINYFTKLNFNVISGLLLINMKNNQHSIKDIRANNYIMSGEEFTKKFNFDFKMYKNIQKNEQPINEKIVMEEMRKILDDYDKKIK